MDIVALIVAFLLVVGTGAVFYVFFVVPVHHPDGAIVERLGRPVRVVQSGLSIRVPYVETMKLVDGGDWSPTLPVENVPTITKIRNEDGTITTEPGVKAYVEVRPVLSVFRGANGQMVPWAMKASVYKLPGDHDRSKLTDILCSMVRDAAERFISHEDARDLNQPVLRDGLRNSIGHRLSGSVKPYGFQLNDLFVMEVSAPELNEAVANLQKAEVKKQLALQEAEGLTAAVNHVKAELGEEAAQAYAQAQIIKSTGIKPTNVTTVGTDMNAAIAGLLANPRVGRNGKP